MIAALLFFFIFFGLIVGLFVFWIVTLIEVIRLADWQYQQAGTEKLLWVIVVLLTHWLGAVIWRVAGYRDRVLAQTTPRAGPPGYGQSAQPISSPTPVPPSWQPDPQVPGGLRWWDGTAWTEHTNSQ